jgi:hypothetical protein
MRRATDVVWARLPATVAAPDVEAQCAVRARPGSYALRGVGARDVRPVSVQSLDQRSDSQPRVRREIGYALPWPESVTPFS